MTNENIDYGHAYYSIHDPGGIPLEVALFSNDS